MPEILHVDKPIERHKLKGFHRDTAINSANVFHVTAKIGNYMSLIASHLTFSMFLKLRIFGVAVKIHRTYLLMSIKVDINPIIKISYNL